MGRLLKFFVWLVAGVVGVAVIAAVSLVLFFDPNDFRDRISAAVKESTGRDLVVGEINLSVFPWLAVEVGRTELGNAEGFDSAEFLSFEAASLSVKIMPLILRQEVEVGTAALEQAGNFCCGKLRLVPTALDDTAHLRVNPEPFNR